MLLPNVNALVLAVLLVYFVRPSPLIWLTADLMIHLDSVLLNTHRSAPPAWLAGVCWIADLLWVPIMLWRIGQPSIALIVLTGIGAERPDALLIALIGASAYLFLGVPRLARWLGRESRVMAAPTSSEDAVTP